MTQLSRGQIYYKLGVLADQLIHDLHRGKGYICDFDGNILGAQQAHFIDYRFPNVYVTKETILRNRLLTGLYRMFCSHKGGDVIHFHLDGDQVRIGLLNEEKLADQAINILTALEMPSIVKDIQQILILRKLWKETA